MGLLLSKENLSKELKDHHQIATRSFFSQLCWLSPLGCFLRSVHPLPQPQPSSSRMQGDPDLRQADLQPLCSTPAGAQEGKDPLSTQVALLGKY